MNELRYLSVPSQTVFPFAGPQAPFVDVDAVVTGATQMELSSQRLVQLFHN